MQTTTVSTEKNSTSKFHFFWENTELSICLISMVAMTAIAFMQVIARYVFNFSFNWAEEICRFLVVWVTFGGSAYAFRKGAHIGVTALINLFPSKLKFGFEIFSKAITIFFFIILLYYGWGHTYQQILNGQVAPATRLPIAISYLAVPVGSFLVLCRLFFETYGLFKNRNQGVK